MLILLVLKATLIKHLCPIILQAARFLCFMRSSFLNGLGHIMDAHQTFNLSQLKFNMNFRRKRNASISLDILLLFCCVLLKDKVNGEWDGGRNV